MGPSHDRGQKGIQHTHTLTDRDVEKGDILLPWVVAEAMNSLYRTVSEYICDRVCFLCLLSESECRRKVSVETEKSVV